ncbi:MAG TPA: DNA polymerase III subunit delta [Candidatus Saccharimonadales bacterium]|nr:DNA polymerase III subunit delta [Candidatus Saccharimonadales bacterium]
MITLFVGENSFDIQRTLDMVISSFDGNVEKIEGSELQVLQLPDIFMGVSLFADKRLVVIRSLSENKDIWPVLGDWLPKISDDIHLVLVEPKPDKRTSTYKSLQKMANVHEFLEWSDRDVIVAEKWVSSQAEKMKIDMNKKLIQTLVQWVGINQWQLFYALEKLSLTDEITEQSIKNIIEPNPVENVFNLFETALRGDTKTLVEIIKTLEKTEDVYRLTALLSSQAFQLLAVASASKSDNVAKDFAVHPYVVSKLSPIAKRLGKSGTSKVISIFTELDDDMKLSRAEPWLLVERALIKVASF